METGNTPGGRAWEGQEARNYSMYTHVGFTLEDLGGGGIAGVFGRDLGAPSYTDATLTRAKAMMN